MKFKSIRQAEHDVEHDVMPCLSVVESRIEPQATENSISANVCVNLQDNNVGVDEAVVVGCNANNGNASARTVNGNNAVSNGNDNYAGRFSLPFGIDFGKTYTTCSARTNTTEEVTHCSFEEAMALLQCEYSGSDSASESNASASYMESNIWEELKLANSKRHLKNLKRFLTNKVIVAAAVERCFSKAAKSKELSEAVKRKDEIIEEIISEMENESYTVRGITQRLIHKRGKGDKDRNANIFSLYDRCIQNLLFIVIGPKLHNKLLRNVYSGVQGRSILSNDRRYSLVTRVHDYCVKHPNDYVMMTDIRHFYESLRSDIVLGILFETVYDRYTRILLSEILLSLPSLPIGGTLSQVCAMLVLNECDRYILEHFKPTIYCIFGDNRFFGDADKKKLIKIREYQNIWYSSRLCLDMKKDYSLHKVKDGFRLCKTDYDDKYVKIRAEMRRRAIRGAIRGQQHYAGYKGFLIKSDSKRLKTLIETSLSLLRRKIKPCKRDFTLAEQNSIDSMEQSCSILNKNKLQGEKLSLASFLGHTVCITNYERVASKKESGNDHFYVFQIVVPVIDETGKSFPKLFRTWNSSADILYFFERVENGSIKLPIYTKIKKDGNSFYFDGYKDFMKDCTLDVINQFNISFDESDYKPMVK